MGGLNDKLKNAEAPGWWHNTWQQAARPFNWVGHKASGLLNPDVPGLPTPPPPPDESAAIFKELARQATEKKLRMSKGLEGSMQGNLPGPTAIPRPTIPGHGTTGTADRTPIAGNAMFYAGGPPSRRRPY